MEESKKGEEMIYGLTVDEHTELQRGLRELPETMPPRAVWVRIREQAEAEGLIGKPRLRPSGIWGAGLGLAATVLLAAVIVPGIRNSGESTFPVVPDNLTTSNSEAVNVLEALMVESRQLESDLRSLPDEPHVVRAGTQATILELEDRIAAIDYQLSDPDVQMTPEDQEIFWRERVRLMKSLVRLRYAQAQRTAF
ncbi:MAG: hypothetical protein OER97_07070 [Gammaproteobacteria bacterium]|nr:hypothetical protein [Gammaproteobacteria bacterium]